MDKRCDKCFYKNGDSMIYCLSCGTKFKNKNLDAEIESGANYDPLSDIKSGKLSLINPPKKQKMKSLGGYIAGDLTKKIERLNQSWKEEDEGVGRFSF